MDIPKCYGLRVCKPGNMKSAVHEMYFEGTMSSHLDENLTQCTVEILNNIFLKTKWRLWFNSGKLPTVISTEQKSTGNVNFICTIHAFLFTSSVPTPLSSRLLQCCENVIIAQSQTTRTALVATATILKIAYWKHCQYNIFSSVNQPHLCHFITSVHSLRSTCL